MLIGYARVSTKRQAEDGTSLQSQISRLEGFGAMKVVTDAATGSNSLREGFKGLLSEVREGDTVVVTKLDRFGRSTADLVRILDLWEEKGITLVSLDDGVNTSTSMGRAMAKMIGIFAELENDRRRERTEEGIEKAREKGIEFGRPKMVVNETVIKKARKYYDDDEMTIKEAYQALGCGRSKFYEILALSK